MVICTVRMMEVFEEYFALHEEGLSESEDDVPASADTIAAFKLYQMLQTRMDNEYFESAEDILIAYDSGLICEGSCGDTRTGVILVHKNGTLLEVEYEHDRDPEMFNIRVTQRSIPAGLEALPMYVEYLGSSNWKTWKELVAAFMKIVPAEVKEVRKKDLLSQR